MNWHYHEVLPPLPYIVPLSICFSDLFYKRFVMEKGGGESSKSKQKQTGVGDQAYLYVHSVKKTA